MSNIAGGFTPFRDLTKDDRDVFAAAQPKVPTGMFYEPVQVSTQVVAGINFRFLCVGKGSPSTRKNVFMQYVFESLEGEVKLEDTKMIFEG